MKNLTLTITIMALSAFSLSESRLMAQGRLYSGLYFTSTPESWVGQGLTLYTEGVGIVPYGQYGAYFFSGASTIIIGGVGGVHGNPLEIGEFLAIRFGWDGLAALDFSYGSRGNNTLTGTIKVLEIGYTEPDLWGQRQITSAAIDFTQFDGGVASRRSDGSLRFNSTIPVNVNVPEPNTLALTLMGLAIALALLRFPRRR